MPASRREQRLGVAGELVDEVGEAVTDRLGAEQAHWLFITRVAERALALAEHDQVDRQPVNSSP